MVHSSTIVIFTLETAVVGWDFPDADAISAPLAFMIIPDASRVTATSTDRLVRLTARWRNAMIMDNVHVDRWSVVLNAISVARQHLTWTNVTRMDVCVVSALADLKIVQKVR